MKTPSLPGSQLHADHPNNGVLIPRRYTAEANGIGENEQTERALSTVSLRCFVTQHDIANMALYLCSPFGRTISGQAISVDGDTQVLM